ncbi:MAG: hypothetical protein HQM09_12725 [Candidatus Riflebacteria bacterium]|nr:hypothetical protein [Candidatus Riflebacteria bacterium]
MKEYSILRPLAPLCLGLLLFALGSPAFAETPTDDKDGSFLDIPSPGTTSAATSTNLNPELVLPMPKPKDPTNDEDPNGPSDERLILKLPHASPSGLSHSPHEITAPAPLEIPRSNKSPSSLPDGHSNSGKISSPPATEQAQGSKTGEALPKFPKDTSSAIFMVMKTWECSDYDGKTLIEHAIGVYSKEAEDPFEAKGLKELPNIKITLKEDDVTLDELLDSIAAKTGIDWGVDIAQKSLYLYPHKQ